MLVIWGRRRLWDLAVGMVGQGPCVTAVMGLVLLPTVTVRGREWCRVMVMPVVVAAAGPPPRPWPFLSSGVQPSQELLALSLLPHLGARSTALAGGSFSLPLAALHLLAWLVERAEFRGEVFARRIISVELLNKFRSEGSLAVSAARKSLFRHLWQGSIRLINGAQGLL